MTLQQLYKQFKTQQVCIKYLEKVIWNNIPVCPYCECKKQTPMLSEQRYHCNDCRTSYSVTAKTMFHKTKVDLQKWFFAIPVIISNNVSARQLAKTLDVSKDTACFMVMRVKLANKENPELIKQFLNDIT